jgi:small multidrug resistance pump
MTQAYIYLFIAIVAEVIATSALKASQEFTRLVPSLVVVAGYAIAFYSLSLTFKMIPLGVSYAIWSGLGIILITLIGLFYYRQVLDTAAIIGVALIVLGVLVINLFSNSVVE